MKRLLKSFSVSAAGVLLVAGVAVGQSAGSTETTPATGMSSTASASPDKFKCENANLVRRVEINREQPGNAVPCVVNYYKDTENPGQMQVLWRSQNEEGFCSDKVAAFIDKLSGWGWSCNAL